MLKQGEIKFNYRSNLDFNLKLENYPSIPQTNEEYEEIKVDGRNGSLTLNKGTYPDKILPFIFTQVSDDIHVDLERVITWLIEVEDNRLFYGRNDRVYIVKKVIIGNFAQEFKTFGNIEIKFICEPFMCEYEETELTLYNNDIIYYEGTAPSDGVIKVYGNGNIQLTINNETIQVKNLDEYIVIDGKLMQVRDKNGRSKDFDTIGDFIIFTKGEYKFSYTSNVSKIEVKYTTKYR